MIAPVLEELDQDMGNQVKIVKIDVDQNQETANKFGIMSIPTLSDDTEFHGLHAGCL